jgi:hypothetical protein
MRIAAPKKALDRGSIANREGRTQERFHKHYSIP